MWNLPIQDNISDSTVYVYLKVVLSSFILVYVFNTSMIGSNWVKSIFGYIYDDELSDIVVSGEVNKTIGDDDNCVLLACDPENQVKCVNDSPTRYNVSCELLIFFSCHFFSNKFSSLITLVYTCRWWSDKLYPFEYI